MRIIQQIIFLLILKLLNDEIDDISLFKEDVLTIISKNDLNKDEYIKISGEVNNPGTYPFSNNLSLSDIITLSGGFNENSFKNRIEIMRRISKTSLKKEISKNY